MLASMKALKIQPYQASPPSSAVVVGRMVATARASNAIAATTSASPNVSGASGGLQMPGASGLALVSWPRNAPGAIAPLAQRGRRAPGRLPAGDVGYRIARRAPPGRPRRHGPRRRVARDGRAGRPARRRPDHRRLDLRRERRAVAARPGLLGLGVELDLP